MTGISNQRRVIFSLPLTVVALALTGCWTPPNANVQPRGEPRLIQSGVSAEVYHLPATVKSIDASNQNLDLEFADGTATTCTINPQVKTSRTLVVGDRIKVSLAEKLAVYVLKDGRVPGPDGTEEVIPYTARVQVVDTSYRLLTLQFLNGQKQVLKTDLNAKLSEMHPGDAVVLLSAEAMAIKLEKP